MIYRILHPRRPFLLIPAQLALLVFACAACPLHAQDNAGASTLPPPPSWDTLKAAYNYDSKTPPVVKEEAMTDPNYLVLHISFTNTKGQTVPGVFVRPKADGVYPCVLLLHGLGSDKETMVKYFGQPFASKGVASLALDSDLHGERKKAGAAPPTDPMVIGSILHQSVIEYRQALDYLDSRKDIDNKRIGLLGYSMGAMLGSIVSGVDERVKAAVLCVGGDPVRGYVSLLPDAMRVQVESISPSNYVGHISPRPVFMINAKNDKVMSEASAKLLQDSAKEPKEILWADSGHILPADTVIKAGLWLVDKLGVK